MKKLIFSALLPAFLIVSSMAWAEQTSYPDRITVYGPAAPAQEQDLNTRLTHLNAQVASMQQTVSIMEKVVALKVMAQAQQAPYENIVIADKPQPLEPPRAVLPTPLDFLSQIEPAAGE